MREQIGPVDAELNHRQLALLRHALTHRSGQYTVRIAPVRAPRRHRDRSAGSGRPGAARSAGQTEDRKAVRLRCRIRSRPTRRRTSARRPVTWGSVTVIEDTGAAQPPIAKRVHSERTHHGDTFVDDYAWLAHKDDPGHPGLSEGRERLRRRGHRAPRRPARSAVRRDQAAHAGDRSVAAGPQGRVLVLHPHDRGRAVRRAVPRAGRPRASRRRP